MILSSSEMYSLDKWWNTESVISQKEPILRLNFLEIIGDLYCTLARKSV